MPGHVPFSPKWTTNRLGEKRLAESFFATLKRELVEDRVFGDRDVTRREVFDYIETFYNRHRKHSFNAGLSPVDFEACQSKSSAA